MTRALLALVLLAGASGAASAQLPDYVPRTISADYESDYAVYGRVEDVDGRVAPNVVLRIDLEGPEGPVAKPIQRLEAECDGDFDAFWPLHNLSKRMTVKVTVGGKTYEQAVNDFHRRNDFKIRLDEAIPDPTDPKCLDLRLTADRRATVAGQVLRSSAPYQGPKGNTLHAEPVSALPVLLKYTGPNGTTIEDKAWTNLDGAYRYSFVFPEPPRSGSISVEFEDRRGAFQNLTFDADDVKYFVVSRPDVDPRPPRDTPGAPLAALVAAAVAAGVLARRRAA